MSCPGYVAFCLLVGLKGPVSLQQPGPNDPKCQVANLEQYQQPLPLSHWHAVHKAYHPGKELQATALKLMAWAEPRWTVHCVCPALFSFITK